MRGRHASLPLHSYEKARLQVVGYRTLQNSINSVLSKYELNTSQWIILGYLHDSKQGMRVTTLASTLDVETPLITTLINSLQRRELIVSKADPEDKRAKRLQLTDDGHDLVLRLEQKLKENLQYFETGFKKGELDAYFEVLARFIDNAKQYGN
jgi:MarR family transcriptional regulator for hemolysin